MESTTTINIITTILTINIVTIITTIIPIKVIYSAPVLHTQDSHHSSNN